MLVSHEPIQGIPIQGPFDLDDFPLEWKHSKEDCDRYYFVLWGCWVEVEPPIDLRAFQDTPLPASFRVRGWETLMTIQGTLYPHHVHMFYSNIHSVVSGLMFWVTMYSQTFMVSTQFIRCVSGMPLFASHFSVFSLKVHALTTGELVSIPVTLYGKSCPMSTYVSIADFTKSTWVLATYLSYSFYPLSYHAQIWYHGLLHSCYPFWVIVRCCLGDSLLPYLDYMIRFIYFSHKLLYPVYLCFNVCKL